MNSATTFPIERLHRGNGLDAELARNPRVSVGVEFGELDLTSTVLNRLLEGRAQRAARPAPLRPEVDDHGDLLRALQDLGLELLFTDVADHASSVDAGTSAPDQMAAEEEELVGDRAIAPLADVDVEMRAWIRAPRRAPWPAKRRPGRRWPVRQVAIGDLDQDRAAQLCPCA